MNDRHDGSDELIAIAVIGKAHGIKGDLCLTPFGASLESIECPCNVRVGTDPQQSVVMTIEELWDVGGRLVCRIKGFDDRNAAETLRSKLVFLEASKLPAKAENEFFHHELIGLPVFTGKSETPLGTVRQVENYPTVDALEVVKADGSTITIPLTAEILEKVDLKAGRITVNAEAIEEIEGI